VRRALIVAAAALVTVCYPGGPALGASPGLPAVPTVDARAFLILDARTGEVLAASNAHERLPIASITKLMTVLVTLQHHKLSDVVTVDPRAAAVGESRIPLSGGDRLTVRDLVEGALIQSANDAADALALSVSPDYPSFARLMNDEASRLGLADTHFVRPDGLDAAGEYSSAADVTTLARKLMRIRFVRQTVRRETATIGGGRVLHTWDDLLGVLPDVLGVKTGHTAEAGWCQVAAIRGRGVTVYATLLGSPTRSLRNADLASLLEWGLAQFRVVAAIQGERTYATVALPFGRRRLGLVAARPLNVVVRLGRPLSERVTAALAASLPVRRGAVLGHVQIWQGGALLGTRALVADRSVGRPSLAGRLGFYAGRTLHHLAHIF
jgi:serine-type D-Ala-D-Ala carboxypeptidase (penicillin-binding protein 5/6)